jgi:hypothetical protein
MIKEAGIDFINLPNEAYDAPMGQYKEQVLST